jgi:hypothetical protein
MDHVSESLKVAATDQNHVNERGEVLEFTFVVRESTRGVDGRLLITNYRVSNMNSGYLVVLTLLIYRLSLLGITVVDALMSYLIIIQYHMGTFKGTR